MRLYIRKIYPVAFFATITLVVIALATTFLLWDLKKRELQHARVETVGITRMFVEQTEKSFEGIDFVIKGIQDRLQNSFAQQFPLDSLEIHLLLGARTLGSNYIDALYLFDERGVLVNSSINFPVKKASFKNEPYFKDVFGAHSEAPFVDKPTFDPVSKQWVIYISKEVKNSEGVSKGVLVVSVAIKHFEDIYRYLKLDYARPVSLYRNDGVLISSFPHRESLVGQRAPELAEETLALPNTDVHFFSHAKGNGEREEHTLAKVPGYPFLISVVNDSDEALASWRETSIPISIVMILISIFIISISTLMIGELRRELVLSEALIDATQRYHHTIDAVMDAIIAIDESQIITLFNPAAEKMFGYKMSDVVGKPLTMLLPARYREHHSVHVGGYKASGPDSRIMDSQLGIYGLRSDGVEFPIESTISRTEISGKIQLTAVLRDVTDRRQSERNLRDMNQQLRGLSKSLQDIREQERGRIARELHDELGQQLTGLKLDLGWLSARVKDGRPVEVCKIDEMRHLLDSAIKSVRQISTELRPIILDDLGFSEAIAWLADEFIKRSSHVHLKIDLKGQDCVVDADLTTALFRIVQESLTNITRYAHANNVEIVMCQKDGYLILEIKDDGVGIKDNSISSGFGLVSMRERANAFGGTFELIANQHQGVTVRVSFALNLPIFNGVKQNEA